MTWGVDFNGINTGDETTLGYSVNVIYEDNFINNVRRNFNMHEKLMFDYRWCKVLTINNIIRNNVYSNIVTGSRNITLGSSVLYYNTDEISISNDIENYDKFGTNKFKRIRNFS